MADVYMHSYYFFLCRQTVCERLIKYCYVFKLSEVLCSILKQLMSHGCQSIRTMMPIRTGCGTKVCIIKCKLTCGCRTKYPQLVLVLLFKVVSDLPAGVYNKLNIKLIACWYSLFHRVTKLNDFKFYMGFFSSCNL